jgi:hypothetical protein
MHQPLDRIAIFELGTGKARRFGASNLTSAIQKDVRDCATAPTLLQPQSPAPKFNQSNHSNLVVAMKLCYSMMNKSSLNRDKSTIDWSVSS